MPDYRRAWHPGGTYFFTVNLLERHGNDLLTRHIELLRDTVRLVRHRHPFVIHGWVVLPDHLHCVIELPPGDADFSTRWRLIKMNFSKALPLMELRSKIRVKRGERGIWQRRYWEHLIRDEADFRAIGISVQINPVKTWAGQACRGLALFDVSSFCRSRCLSVGLGWVMWRRILWFLKIDRRNKCPGWLVAPYSSGS